jgi:hypothetical protein
MPEQKDSVRTRDQGRAAAGAKKAAAGQAKQRQDRPRSAGDTFKKHGDKLREAVE